MGKIVSRKKPKTLTNRSGLARRVIKEIERRDELSTDKVDPDIETYINAFKQDFANLPRLEKFSLLTPEDAQKALPMLEATNDEVSRLLKNVRALRHLVEYKA